MKTTTERLAISNHGAPCLRAARGLAAVVALAALAGGRASADAEDLEGRAAAILADEVHADAARGAQLASLGADVAPLLVLWLAEAREGCADEESDRTAILIGLKSLPRRASVAPVASCTARAVTYAGRRSLLRVLRYMGSATDIDTALALARSEGLAALETFQIGEELRITLRSILLRDPIDPTILTFNALSVAPALFHSVVEASDGLPRPARVDFLAALIGRRAAQDTYLLTKLDQAIQGCVLPPRPELAADILPFLEHGEPSVVASAARVLGGLQDHGSIEALVRLLGHEEKSISTAAHAALCDLTGLALPNLPDRWSRWLSAEREWRARSAETCLARLDSSSTQAVSVAVQEIGRHRYFRHDLALAVSSVLDRGEASLRLLACQVLADLDSLGAVPKLIPLLNDDELVATAAHRTLQSITGRKLQADADAWWQLLELEASRP